MALNPRKVTDARVAALESALNSTRNWVSANLTSKFHRDITSKDTTSSFDSPTSTADVVSAVGEPATLALVQTRGNECKAVHNRHLADAVAHKTADAVNPFTTADLVVADSQGTTNTWLNNLKTKFNTHLAQATIHDTNDGTNTIVAADATDLGTSKTLVAAISAAINAHVQNAMGGSSVTVVGP